MAPTWSGRVSPAPLPAGVWPSSRAAPPPPPGPRMGEFGEKSAACGTVCLKYLLFTFNCCFWVSSGHPLPRPRRSLARGPGPGPGVVTGVHCPQLAGLAVMAVGIWTLALKSDYISLLASGTYLATAYILVVAGVVVMVTGALGCCATFKERRNLLRLVSGAGRTAGGGGAPCQAAWGGSGLGGLRRETWVRLQDRQTLLCSPGRGSLPTCGSPYPGWASRGKTAEEHWEAGVLQPSPAAGGPHRVATWQLRAVALLCHAWCWASSWNGGVCVPAHLTEPLLLPPVLRPAPYHLSAGDHCGGPGLRLLPAGEGWDRPPEDVDVQGHTCSELDMSVQETYTYT